MPYNPGRTVPDYLIIPIAKKYEFIVYKNLILTFVFIVYICTCISFHPIGQKLLEI